MVLEEFRPLQKKLEDLVESCKSIGLEVEAGLEASLTIPNKFYVRFHDPRSGGVGEIIEAIRVHKHYEDVEKTNEIIRSLWDFPPLDQYLSCSIESTGELIDILKEVLTDKSRPTDPEILSDVIFLLIRKDGELRRWWRRCWRPTVKIVKTMVEIGLHAKYEGWDSFTIKKLSPAGWACFVTKRQQPVTEDNIRKFVEIYGDTVKRLIHTDKRFHKKIKEEIIFDGCTSNSVVWFDEFAKLLPERTRLLYALSAGIPLSDEDLEKVEKEMTRSNAEDRHMFREAALHYLSVVKDERLQKILSQSHISALIRSKYPKKFLEALEFLLDAKTDELNESISRQLLDELARRLFCRDDAKFFKTVVVDKNSYLKDKYLIFALRGGIQVVFTLNSGYYRFRFVKKHPLIGEYYNEVCISAKDASRLLAKDPNILKNCASVFEKYASEFEKALNAVAQQYGLAIKFMKISGTWPKFDVDKLLLYIDQQDLQNYKEKFEEKAADFFKKFMKEFKERLSHQNGRLPSVTT